MHHIYEHFGRELNCFLFFRIVSYVDNFNDRYRKSQLAALTKAFSRFFIPAVEKSEIEQTSYVMREQQGGTIRAISKSSPKHESIRNGACHAVAVVALRSFGLDVP